MDRAQRMDDMGSRDVARASVMLAMTRTREEERRFKEEYAAEGIRTAAVDFGGEFLPSVSRIVERAVIAAKREGVIADTSHEEGVVAGGDARGHHADLCQGHGPERRRQDRHRPLRAACGRLALPGDRSGAPQ